MKVLSWLQTQLQDQENNLSTCLISGLDDLGILAQNTPSMFLMPEKEKADPNQNLAQFEQKIYFQFALVLVVQPPTPSKTNDQQLFWNIIHNSRKAIIGKTPPGALWPVEYLDGGMHSSAKLCTWVDHYQYIYQSSTL